MSAETLVRAAGVSKRFGSKDEWELALRGVSFEIGRGDRIAVVGPSGSGKSSLLLLIAALLEPSEGVVEWPALDRVRLRPNSIGIAFQGPSLIAPLSVIENVALPLLVLGRDEKVARSQAAAALADFGLDDVADKFPDEISGGQGQRAALARAIVTRPALVLADEPTGQQDRDSAHRSVETLIDVLDAYGAALLVATHDPRVAEQMSTQWVLVDGRLNPGRVP